MNFIPQSKNIKKTFLKIFKKYEKKSNKICFGSFGFFSLENKLIYSKEINTIKKLIKKKIKKKKGKVWVRIFPYISITKKPKEVRMGKGKGNIAKWAIPVSKGRILFEFDGVSLKEALSIYILCKKKFSLKIRLLYKNHI